MRNYIRTSFKRKLLLSFLMVAVLPLIVCSVFLVGSFKVKIQRDYEKEAAKQLTNVETVITSLFEEFQEISDELSVNENVIESLYIKDTELKKSMYLELYKITSKLRENAQFHLYSKGGICKYSTNNLVLGTNLPTYWGILRAATKEPGTLIVRNGKGYAPEENGILLQAAQAITDVRGNCIGYIVIDMENTHFEKLLEGTYNSLNSVMVLDIFWNTVYSTEPSQKESVVPLLRKQLLAGQDLEKFENGSKFYVTTVGKTNLYIVLEQREVFTASITKTMYRISIIMAIASLSLCVVVAIGLSRSLTKPINNLTKAMHEIESGNLEVWIDSERGDEIGRLSDSFNRMAKELSGYMTSLISQQQELNDAKIARMQAQLNPHFLYNTLDTMKWVAKVNHIPEIVTLSASLAKILRISISEHQFIRLKEEMALVKSYVDIQRIRFSDKFEYEAYIPKELEDCIVPKLVIQPLVENAIIHGLADRDSGHIQIVIEERHHQLMILVSDDGCGMEKDMMENLNSRDREKLVGHLGFNNVDTIIRLHYGQEYGLHASANDTGGTKVTAILPLRKEDINVKGSYS